MITNDVQSFEPALEAKEVKRHFRVRKSGLLPRYDRLRAVDGVTMTVARGQIVGVVGESGCGKSTLARLLAGIDEPTSGEVMFRGIRISSLDRRERQSLRRQLQFVFQDPYESLNPRFTASQIVREPWRYHREFASAIPDHGTRLRELFELVGLGERYLSRRPHQLSGGERQRLGIARALSLEPEVLVLDEPVSALDVSVQAQILNLLIKLKQTLDLSLVVVSHDLTVIRYLADVLVVMYLGKIVERGPVHAVWKNPHHPYTRMLMSSIPGQGVLSPRRAHAPRVAGELPSPINPPSGCNYRTRCWLASDICRRVEPELEVTNRDRVSACHFVDHVAAIEEPESTFTRKQ